MICIITHATFNNQTTLVLFRRRDGRYGVLLWEVRHPSVPRTMFEWRTIAGMSKSEAMDEFVKLTSMVLENEYIVYLTGRMKYRHTFGTYDSWLNVLEDAEQVVS